MMFEADAVFNILCLVLDAVGIRWMWSLHKRRSPWWMQAAVFVSISNAALALAIVVKNQFGYRDFATLRFAGMAAFWHLPVVLLCLALIHRRKAPVVTALLLFGLYAYAYHVEPFRLQVTRYEYSSALLRELRRPIEIAQVSDLQGEHASGYEKKAIEMLCALKPDLIVYTGDYLHIHDRRTYIEEAARLNAIFRAMSWKPPLGSYAVLGDSDLSREWTRVFEDTPVTLLSNQTVELDLSGARATLIGLAPWTSRSSNKNMLRFAVGELPDRQLHIFVGHAPDFVSALEEESQPFLAIAGHTHGGQVQLPFVGALLTLSSLPRKYADYYGAYGSGVLSVSRGIGMERYDAPRLRFLCPPEIRVITLRPPKS